jgi:hypothetical protein
VALPAAFGLRFGAPPPSPPLEAEEAFDDAEQLPRDEELPLLPTVGLPPLPLSSAEDSAPPRDGVLYRLDGDAAVESRSPHVFDARSGSFRRGLGWWSVAADSGSRPPRPPPFCCCWWSFLWSWLNPPVGAELLLSSSAELSVIRDVTLVASVLLLL